jgi:hypothetical protein
VGAGVFAKASRGISAIVSAGPVGAAHQVCPPSEVYQRYMRDIARSRTFYMALGFVVQSCGESETSAWC